MSSSNKTACCISNCSSTTTDLTFRFPAKEHEGMAWLRALENEELNKLTYDKIRAQRRGVCYKHFPPDAILVLPNRKRILKKGFFRV